MSKIKFHRPKGTNDFFKEDFYFFNLIFNTFKKIVEFYNFGRIETPILEEANLFLKGVGKMTDICEREMYCLKTKKGDVWALRPEGTSPVARAYLENGLKEWPQPVRLWYFGPFFRHEKPQSGRYRQFWQGGIEIINSSDPSLDVEVLQIFLIFLKELKIKNFFVEVNSLGCDVCQEEYKKNLNHFLKTKERELCENCKIRRKENILRVFDCKEEKCQKIFKLAPQMIDYLCFECKTHFTSFLEMLDALNYPYTLNPFLVRGLDYYTKTVFEIFEQKKDSQKEKKEGEKESEEERRLALIAGGRYDNLIQNLGGERTPAVGGAFGLERLMEILKVEKHFLPKKETIPVFLVQIGNVSKVKTLKLMETLYQEKIKFFSGLGKDSLKAQLKLADKLKVEYSFIFGQKEALEGKVLVRKMKDGTQDLLKIEKAIEKIKKTK
ncbi:MAG: histidine--tRNA ligase [Minisyncoccales bacterium]